MVQYKHVDEQMPEVLVTECRAHHLSSIEIGWLFLQQAEAVHESAGGARHAPCEEASDVQANYAPQSNLWVSSYWLQKGKAHDVWQSEVVEGNDAASDGDGHLEGVKPAGAAVTSESRS